MSKNRFWISILGLLTAFMGAQPWLQPIFPSLEFIPSTGDIYSGIIVALGLITLVIALRNKY